MLEKAHHQDAVVARDDVLGAIAVVDVKVHNRHPFQAMALQRIFGGNGHIVEKAKAHGLVTAGVVPRWAHGTKSVFELACQHGVGGIDGGTRRQQSRFPGVGIDQRVRVQCGVRGATCSHVFTQYIAQTAQGRHVHAPMGQLDVSQCRGTGLSALQGHVDPADQQPVFDGAQALRAFGMPCAHFVLPASGMCEITCGTHTACLPACSAQCEPCYFLELLPIDGFQLITANTSLKARRPRQQAGPGTIKLNAT